MRVGFQGSRIASGSLKFYIRTYSYLFTQSLFGLDNFLQNHEFTGFNFFVRSFGRAIALFYEVDLGGGAQMEPFLVESLIYLFIPIYTVYRFIIEDFDYAGIILLVVLSATWLKESLVLPRTLFCACTYLLFHSFYIIQAQFTIKLHLLQLLSPCNFSLNLVNLSK